MSEVSLAGRVQIRLNSDLKYSLVSVSVIHLLLLMLEWDKIDMCRVYGRTVQTLIYSGLVLFRFKITE